MRRSRVGFKEKFEIFPTCVVLLFAISLISVPFYFGGERLLAWGYAGIIQTLLLIVMSFQIVRRPQILGIVKSSGGFLPVIIVIPVFVWAIIQILPVIENPFSHPIWAMMSKAIEETDKSYWTISVSPDEGFITLYKFMIVLIAFINGMVIAAFFKYKNSRFPIKFITFGISLSGTIYSVIGMMMVGLRLGEHFWLEKAPYYFDVVSTFVNRNTFAMYVGITSHATLSLILSILTRQRFRETFRDRTLKLLTTQLPSVLPLLAFYVIQISALIMAHSRAGFISVSSAQAAILIILFARARRAISSLLPIVILAGISIYYILSEYSQILAQRFDNLNLYADGRLDLYREIIGAIGERPILGYGLGSFESVFRYTKSVSFDPEGIWLRAHNSYLESALALGIPATLLLLIAIMISIKKAFRDLFERNYSSITILACMTSISVFLHAFVDFGIQSAATAVTAFAILGASMISIKQHARNTAN